MAEFFQFVAQFQVVVDFPVEHDGYVAIVRQNRLVAGPEVYNFEPRSAHRTNAGLEDTLLVRSTMNQCGGSVPNTIGIRYPAFVGKTNDSTQVRAPLSLLESACDYRADRLAETRDSAKPGRGASCQLLRQNSNRNGLFEDAQPYMRIPRVPQHLLSYYRRPTITRATPMQTRSTPAH